MAKAKKKAPSLSHRMGSLRAAINRKVECADFNALWKLVDEIQGKLAEEPDRGRLKEYDAAIQTIRTLAMKVEVFAGDIDRMNEFVVAEARQGPRINGLLVEFACLRERLAALESRPTGEYQQKLINEQLDSIWKSVNLFDQQIEVLLADYRGRKSTGSTPGFFARLRRRFRLG
jgi:hypothetical protein